MQKLITILVMFALLSCGSKNEENTSSAGAIKNSCIADLVESNEIEKMLTKEQLAVTVDIESGEIEMKDNKSGSAKYSTVAYNWEPAEERYFIMETKIPAGAGGETEVIETKTKAVNKVSFGQVEVFGEKIEDPQEYFRYTYGPKTAEEKEKIKEQVDKSQKTSDKVDKKSAETIKKMLDKENSTELEVGDMAFWSKVSYANVTEAKIRVLHGNTMFTVSADVSENIEEDLEVAKRVAAQIIANCD